MCRDGSEETRAPREWSRRDVHDMANRGVTIGCTRGIVVDERDLICEIRSLVADKETSGEGST